LEREDNYDMKQHEALVKRLEHKQKGLESLLDAFNKSYEYIKEASQAFREQLAAREKELKEHTARLREREEEEANL
jgi:exonuclease VII small subunit